jgi:hypothetical protein
MAMFQEGRGLASEAEPLGLLTEGAAGIAVIVLAVIALAGTSSGALASIVTIVVGVGLMVQAFNSAAENSKVTAAANAAPTPDLGGEVMIGGLSGITGIILGILALVGINPAYLVPSALIVFGGALLLSGAIGLRPRASQSAAPGGQAQIVSYQGSPAASGMEILIGIAAIVLGVLALIFVGSWVLALVGFIAVGAALLMVSATFSGTMMRLFTTTG